MKFKLAPKSSAKADSPPIDPPSQDSSPSARPSATAGQPSLLQSKWLVMGLFAVIILGLALFAYAGMNRTRTPVTSTVPDEQIFKDHNVAVRPPAEPWVRDRTLENSMRVNLGIYTRKEPDGWFGYAAQKFDTRNARRSDLMLFLDGRLKMLCENVNREEKEGATWLGQPAVRFEFRGTNRQDVVIAGECMAVTFNGIAYYFFGWSAERDLAAFQADFDTAKQQVRTLKLRENWKETKAAGNIFASKKLDYKLTDSEGIWKQPKNSFPTDEDALADLLIRAEIVPKGQNGDAKFKADAFAFVLPGAADANKAAIDFVTTRKSRNPEMHQELKAEEVKEPIEGDDPVGEPPANPVATTRFKIYHPKSPDSAKLVVISALATNGKVVAVEATCLWRERSVWERRLVNLAGSIASTEGNAGE
ncbi:MAG: hypothetical protein U0798_16805 [Gemmataceae bacterium]